MLQTKITFHSKSKHQDDFITSNLQTNLLQVCRRLPFFSPYNYDIGYFVSNYAINYSCVANGLSNSEVQHLVQSVFVPCKTFSFPKNVNGRSFQHTWIDKFPWLTYSKMFDGAFCLPCVLFGYNFSSECTTLERLFSKPLNYGNDASAYFKKHVFGKNNNKLVYRNNNKLVCRITC